MTNSVEPAVPTSKHFLSLAIALSAPASAAAQQGPPDLIRAVVAERNARERAREACSDAPELRARILAGTVDAETEASAAAARGCFGLITGYSAIPRGVPFGVGVACRPNGQLFRYGRLMRLSFAGSDGISGDVEREEQERRNLARIRIFALAYNRAVLARPELPYRDLCRVEADDYRPGVREETPPGEWGYRPLEETEAPIDMYEAARRGTPASLRRWIERRPLDLHVPDLLGLTPLAWAVIYDRPEQARLLLEAGAHPYGEPYWDRPQQLSPITIAQQAHNRRMVRLIRPYLETRRLTVPEAEGTNPSRN